MAPSVSNSKLTNTELQSCYSTPSQQSNYSASKTSQLYRHALAAHKISTWPAIHQILLQSLPGKINNMNDYDSDGVTFFMELSQSYSSLPLDDGLYKLPFLGIVCLSTYAAFVTTVVQELCYLKIIWSHVLTLLCR